MPSGEGPVHGETARSSLRAAAAMVFVADVDALETTTDQSHHLARVLRLRRGEVVAAADGAGNWRLCRYCGPAAAGAGPSPLLEAAGPVASCAPPSPEVTVAFVPVKGDRPEWTVQKLTEAGVDRIAVLRSARGVVRWERSVLKVAGSRAKSPPAVPRSASAPTFCGPRRPRSPLACSFAG